MQGESQPRPHHFGGEKEVQSEQRKADRMKTFSIDTVRQCAKTSIHTLYTNLYALKRILNSNINSDIASMHANVKPASSLRQACSVPAYNMLSVLYLFSAADLRLLRFLTRLTEY